MLGQGVHPKEVSERLGHASVNITLDTYGHVLPGLQEAAAAALDSVLAEPSSQRLVSTALAGCSIALRRTTHRRAISCGDCGGRYRTRTCDFLGVSEAL
jgi:hypothetical protein